MGSTTEYLQNLKEAALKNPTRKSPAHTVVNCTDMGKKRVEDRSLDGRPGTVLEYVDDHGPCSVLEVSQRTGIQLETTRSILNDLLKQGFIRKEGAS